MGFRSSPAVKVLVSVLSGGRSVFARRVFLYQVGTCRVQSKPRPGYFEPLWKARSRFSFHYSCFYIWGCWMSTKSSILLWILELLKGKECICAEGCMYSISATPGSFFFFLPPPPLTVLCLSCELLIIGTLQCREDDTSFCHSASTWHPVRTSCKCSHHPPAKKTNSVPQHAPEWQHHTCPTALTSF